MKNKNINNILLAIAVSSALAACGGDGTTDNTNDTNNIPDVTAPVISLNGNSNVSILINDSYQDLGAFADDAVDGSVGVTQMGSVDTSIGGSYIIAYNAVDLSGNAADEVTRTVTVIDGTPIAAPQALYNVEYDLYSGFEFDKISINESSISAVEGEIANNALIFPAQQGDLYYAASAGEWIGRNPANIGFERVELNTVGIVNGIRKLTIESIEDISGQRLVVGGSEIDNNLPDGAARYSIRTELLEDSYSIYRKISFNGVVAQTLDEALTSGCGETDLVEYVDSDQLTGASIPCSQVNQTSGTLTANTTTGGVVTDAGIWSIGKIAGSEIDVLTIKLNPVYLRAESDQLTEHPIFAIKDGEVWSGDMTIKGDVELDTFYNETAIESRILNGCFNEDSAGRYIDC